jgi:purine nucleosidase
VKILLDTDLGSYIDDACALAMLLGWPDAELIGITTTMDPHGRRAGFVRELLRRAGRDGIPVAAGAHHSLATRQMPGWIPDDERYWGHGVAAAPTPAGAAMDLMEAAVAQEATVVAIGPLTNLALFDALRPGRLAEVPVVAMAGCLGPDRPGFPTWEAKMDWNVQCDGFAAEAVAAAAPLTLVPLPAAATAVLRGADLARLRASGALGELLVRQATVHAVDEKVPDLGRRHPGLPDDLLSFQFDAVTAAVALGWDGAEVTTMALRTAVDGEVVSIEPAVDGRPTRVVTGIDADAFGELWLSCVETADRGTQPAPSAR